MSSQAPHRARVIQLRPATAVAEAVRPARTVTPAEPRTDQAHRILPGPQPVPAVKEPLWRHIVGDVLRRERLAQERRLRDVADEARISMPYLSEIERGRKEASSEVLAAAAHALGLSLADLLTLAQDELARLTRPGRPSQATPAERPNRAITPAQPAPERDLDCDTIASPGGGNAPAEQPTTGEARLASAGIGSSGHAPADQPTTGEARLAADGVGPSGNAPADQPATAEARLAFSGIGPIEAGVAGGAEVDVVADEAGLVPGEVWSAEAGLSSWQVKLSLAA